MAGLLDTLKEGAKRVGLKAMDGLDSALDSMGASKPAIKAPPPPTPQESQNSDLAGNINKKNKALKELE